MSDPVKETLEAMGLEDCPESRLALKLTRYWAYAIYCGDLDWIEAHNKEMEPLMGLEDLERLQKLYDWAREHPPKAESLRR